MLRSPHVQSVFGGRLQISVARAVPDNVYHPHPAMHPESSAGRTAIGWLLHHSRMQEKPHSPSSVINDWCCRLSGSCNQKPRHDSCSKRAVTVPLCLTGRSKTRLRCRATSPKCIGSVHVNEEVTVDELHDTFWELKMLLPCVSWKSLAGEEARGATVERTAEKSHVRHEQFTTAQRQAIRK